MLLKITVRKTVLRCAIDVGFLKHIIKEYNASMHNFTVAIVEYSYMFWLLQSNHHQAVYQKYKKEIRNTMGIPRLQITKIISFSYFWYTV
jgi:hypothetical protein